jgi:hypothetical protein
MGRIFISAGHGGQEGSTIDPGVIAGNTTEAKEMILLRDLIVPELRSQGFEVLSVPDNLSALATIAWINARYLKGDIAVEIHADSSINPNLRGVSAYYIGNNNERKSNADELLLALLSQVPDMINRGAIPDTNSALGRLDFCRKVIPPSVIIQLGFLTNIDDRSLLINRRSDVAKGLSRGMATWSREVSEILPPDTSSTEGTEVQDLYPAINIAINNQGYDEQGIVINSNAYIPVDLVDQLDIDVSKNPDVQLVSYRGVVYMRAVELRDFSVNVSWEANTRTVVISSISRICTGQIDAIMGHGNATEMNMMVFLKQNNANAVTNFADIPKIYREEAAIEGINYDVAFCQMCLETNFLRFGGDVKSIQNNFANLGSIGGGPETASFDSARIGVRAHIQHLKAYASTEPLVQELVDPRFKFVRRGVAPLVSQLSTRWTVDPNYGEKIMNLVRRLYEVSKLI